MEFKVMRVGIFGGTFDPIHIGHLILAEACREACALDIVQFVVAGEPPHKGRPRTAAKHRLEMVELAIAGHNAFEASEIELSRPGPHYSFETLEQIHESRPTDQLASLVVVNRPGIEPATIANYKPIEGSKPFYQVTMPDVGIASRKLRQRVADGQSVRYLVPRAVEIYLTHHGLYRDA